MLWRLDNIQNHESYISSMRMFCFPQGLTIAPDMFQSTGPVTSSCCWRCPHRGNTGICPSALPIGSDGSWCWPQSIACCPLSILQHMSFSQLTMILNYKFFLNQKYADDTSALWALDIWTCLEFNLKQRHRVYNWWKAVKLNVLSLNNGWVTEKWD